MDKDALAKFEKIADEMPCMHEFIVNCKLIQTSKSRETCGCPGCMFRRMITSLREEKALVAREDLSEYRLGDRKIIAELIAMAEKLDCMVLGPRFPPDEDVTIVIRNLDGTDGAACFPGCPHCRML